ncbi:MAG: response regulator [Candidatus Omnitrophica bacterium]|nr:response regulator [Candidatus Omnitrophota bacterium]
MGKKRILIVEDEGTSRALLAAELQRAGYQVFQSKSGEEAFQVAKAVRPDLIISDIVMPGMDGNQLIKRVRQSEFGKNIPFIVLTAHANMQDYFELMDVEDFITKPFDPQDLVARVEKVFAKAKEDG